MRLGVNIDHVATLRNARGGVHPDPVKASKLVEKAGADLIVVHLREDRRHIREEDIAKILKQIKIPLQLEIAPTKFMFNYSIKNNIKKVCVVPEKRKELTTEGGLDLKKSYKFLKSNIPILLKNNIEVSLFLDPKIINVKLSKKLGINAIEFHTGEFANAKADKEKKLYEKLKSVIDYAYSNKVSVRAGHGLTFNKVKKIVKIRSINELNIGHFIIGESIFYGLENVVKEMKHIMKKS